MQKRCTLLWTMKFTGLGPIYTGHKHTQRFDCRQKCNILYAPNTRSKLNA